MNPTIQQAIHAGEVAGTTLTSGVHAAAKVFTALRELGVGDALRRFGLERRRSPLLSLGVFGAGIAVGAGVGILFAPKSGKDTRAAIASAFKRGEKKAESVVAEAGAGFHEVTTFS